MQALRDIKLPGIKKLRSGKVREVFDLGDTLLFVVSDRLSAFDVILPDPIPYKGAVLNQISAYWFQKLDFAKNHFITADFDEFPQSLHGFRDQLAGRSMLVKKTEPLSIECVVRGYLAGSGWKDYQQTGSVCGVKLPEGLQLASKLPGPIFTPSTKSDVGHDLNIDLDQAGRMVGAELRNCCSEARRTRLSRKARCRCSCADEATASPCENKSEKQKPPVTQTAPFSATAGPPALSALRPYIRDALASPCPAASRPIRTATDRWASTGYPAGVAVEPSGQFAAILSRREYSVSPLG
jgi:hypothetical protein